MANGVPFFVDPTYGRTGQEFAGLANVIRENRDRQEAKDRAAADEAAFMKAFETRDPKDIAAVASRNPQVANLIYKQIGIDADRQDAETAMKKREASDFARQIVTAAPERRKELFQRRIDSINARDGDASETIQSYQDFLQDEEGEIKNLEFFWGAVDDKGYSAFAKSREAGAERDIKLEDLNIKKQNTKIRQEEAALRKEQQRLNAETNALKREDLEIKIQQRQQKIEQDKKDVQAAASGALDSVERSIGTVDRLLEHPGLESAVGFKVSPYAIPGSDRANFEAELEAFDAQNFLTAIKQMKGMGALSDAEGRKVSAAVGAINPKMSEKAFKESLERIRDTLGMAKQRLADQGIADTPTEQPNPSSMAQSAIEWANANPNDPRAQEVLRRAQMMQGGQ